VQEAVRILNPETTAVPAAGGARLTIAIFIEHDIVYRHFITSGVFADLAARHRVVFVFPEKGPENKRLTVEIDPRTLGGEALFIPTNIERITYWRRLYQVSQLRWRPGAAWRQLRATMRRHVGPRANILYSALALPGIFALYRRWSESMIDRQPTAMTDVLDRLSPDMIVHPTVLEGLFINDVIKLGRARGIPTIAIMNSWDNPSTKRAVFGEPDWLLVWGEQTRNLAVTYMGMDPARTVSFGAAQFEIYRRPPRVARDEFCRSYGIDPAKPILLYAGSSKGSDEFAHLQTIEDAIDRGDLPGISIVYRPHPWGRGGYKGERLLDHPWRHVRIDRSMRGYLEEIRAGRRPIYLADYADTHDILACVDALVSPLSTILLEGMLHGKPVLCFLPDEKQGSSLGLQARHVHFDDFFNNPDVLVVEGDTALIGKLAELMARVSDPDAAARMAKACAHFVVPQREPYGERLTALLEKLAAERPEKTRLGAAVRIS
jgi:hypothetical protein